MQTSSERSTLYGLSRPHIKKKFFSKSFTKKRVGGGRTLNAFYLKLMEGSDFFFSASSSAADFVHIRYVVEL